MSDKLDRWVEKEENSLVDAVNSGGITLKEYKKYVRELHQEAREQEASENRMGSIHEAEDY